MNLVSHKFNMGLIVCLVIGQLAISLPVLAERPTISRPEADLSKIKIQIHPDPRSMPSNKNQKLLLRVKKEDTSDLLSSQPTDLNLINYSAGGADAGGGDLCEDRIKLVRDDLVSWIKQGGGERLKLPPRISLDQYNKSMVFYADQTKIKCVGLGDPEFPVLVDGVPKVCKFQKGQKANSIVCDFRKFNDMYESDHYVLIHHEYAGLSGVEVPNGSDSDYFVSNQISGHTDGQWVNKLVIRPVSTVATSIATPCPLPNSNVTALFKIIEDKTKGESELDDYLNNNLIGLDVLNKNCENPLYVAIRSHNFKMFKFIFEKLTKLNGPIDVNSPVKPAVNGATYFGGEGAYTIYNYALGNGNLETIQYLQGKGGALRYQQTPLMHAAKSNNLEIIKSIIEKDPNSLNQKDDMGSTAFFWAAGFNSIEVVDFFLRKTQAVNLVDKEGTSLLMYAAGHNSASMVRSLISYGADITVADKNKRTALMRAVDGNRWEVSAALLESIPDLNERLNYLNSRDINDNSALKLSIYYCVEPNRTSDRACDTAIYLINAHADVSYDSRILKLAAWHAPENIIQALINAGADKNAKDENGHTAYDGAVYKNRSQKILELLKP